MFVVNKVKDSDGYYVIHENRCPVNDVNDFMYCFVADKEDCLAKLQSTGIKAEESEIKKCDFCCYHIVV